MIFVTPWSQAVCPFCFHRFHLSKAHRRITSLGGEKTKDEQLGRFLSIPAPELGVVEPDGAGGFPPAIFRGFVAPSERNAEKRKICPRCHMYLPNATATGQLSSKIIAIIGARSSGKSNYFGVLLNALERRYTTEVGFTMYDQETFSVNEMKPVSSKHLYRERYGKYLFSGETQQALDQTASVTTNVEVRIPLIYRLEFRKRLVHYLTAPLSRVNAMDLVVFDAAGEDMDDPVAIEQYYRYILGAAGIVFIIDPFQFPGIRSQLSPEMRDRYPKEPGDPAGVVSQVIQLFERHGGLRVGGKIPVPVAFAFSKSDDLKGIVHPSSMILRDSHHEDGFNADDCGRLSEEVEECIREWDGPNLIGLAQRKFRSYSFFALSALGQCPDKDLRIHNVSPVRIADPLLWLLWKQGYLSTARS